MSALEGRLVNLVSQHILKHQFDQSVMEGTDQRKNSMERHRLQYINHEIKDVRYKIYCDLKRMAQNRTKWRAR